MVGRRLGDNSLYPSPIISKIARLIVSDFHMYDKNWDIIMEFRDRKLKWISILHPNFISIQYLFLFVYGEVGYRVNIKYVKIDSEKKKRDDL